MNKDQVKGKSKEIDGEAEKSYGDVKDALNKSNLKETK
jgi:uncharacterized protein YjbJ (UPF0337 family)